MTISEFNKSEKDTAETLLSSCCGSSCWVQSMMKSLPFSDEKDMVNKATDIWYNECTENEWLDAFTHHPKIGDITSLTEKYASTMHLAGKEQSAVEEASPEIIQDLSKANMAYEAKFGFIFIVCATGKSAEQMLRLLNDRMSNKYKEELNIAMGEQHKITILRLKKMLEGNWGTINGSQITSHVLDTSIGKPGKSITIRLKQSDHGIWESVAQGVTDEDGRISDLLPPGKNLPSGNYKMVFDTLSYFNDQSKKGFYPEVEIQFTVTDDSHYHVPLLINPFGYSTYRGS